MSMCNFADFLSIRNLNNFTSRISSATCRYVSNFAKIYDGPNLPFNPRTGNISLNEYMRRHRMIRSRATNKYLQLDHVAHL